MADPSPKSDLPQGTLDLLILKIVAVQPVHGYAASWRRLAEAVGLILALAEEGAP
jgi:DNA-binding PadR family transcriptional regulator